MMNNFLYSTCNLIGDALHFSEKVSLTGCPAEVAEKVLGCIYGNSVPDGTIQSVEFIKQAVDGGDEAYEVRVTPEQIIVTAETAAGLFYGAQAVMRLADFHELRQGLLSDAPRLKRRCFKCYIPSPDWDGMNQFRQLVDMLARYKYNAIMIEIGGAMEFKRHPEINEGWLEYCHFMNEYSGKPRKVQEHMRWEKNSIHTTNGGGKVMVQSMLRELLDYCRKNHLEVIPEMPSLSHCDYLLTRHRELAERIEDPFPDTACPNHPDYYPLLFDLFDEIIEVFQPKVMHIGHDEWYSIALCPRCKGKNAAEILANDIIRCHDYLASKGVATMLWGDKLLKVLWPNGRGCAGSAIPPEECEWAQRPETWQAIDMIPKDVQIMHWYYMKRDTEAMFTDRGFSVTLGNMVWREQPDWSARIAEREIFGTSCSSWGATDLRTLQRNGLLFKIVTMAAASWNASIDSDDYLAVSDWAMKELYHLSKCMKYAGVPVLEICHTCDCKRPYSGYSDGFFVNEENDLMGYHVFRGEEQKEYRLPVIFGTNIQASDVKSERWPQTDSRGYYFDVFSSDSRLFEATFETLPVRRPDGTMAYRTRYVHPAPGQKLSYVGYEPVKGYHDVTVLRIEE